MRYLKKLARFIKKKRMSTGLSINQFAAEYDLQCSSLCRYELGQREPKISALISLAKVYDQTVAEFLSEFEKECINDKKNS